MSELTICTKEDEDHITVRRKDNAWELVVTYQLADEKERSSVCSPLTLAELTALSSFMTLEVEEAARRDWQKEGE